MSEIAYPKILTPPLIQCGQIQKVGWENGHNRENLYILKKLKLHPHNILFISNHQLSTKVCLLCKIIVFKYVQRYQ